MTSPASATPGPYNRITSWLVHRQLVVLVAATVAYCAYAIAETDALKAVATIILAILGVSAGFKITHDMRLCEQCFAAMPLDGPAAGHRRRRTLRAYHIASPPRTLAIAAAIATAELTVPPHGVWTKLLPAVMMTAIAVHAYVVTVHQPLRPWCPQCDWGKGGAGEAHEPTPLPTLILTKTYA